MKTTAVLLALFFSCAALHADSFVVEKISNHKSGFLTLHYWGFGEGVFWHATTEGAPVQSVRVRFRYSDCDPIAPTATGKHGYPATKVAANGIQILRYPSGSVTPNHCTLQVLRVL